MNKINCNRFSLQPKITVYVSMEGLTAQEKSDVEDCLMDLHGGDDEGCYNCVDANDLMLAMTGADEDAAIFFLREVCEEALKRNFIDLVFDFD